MRIWSLHPELLDRQALVACWRETLLAQKVLAGLTVGYRRHPQLDRFRATPDPSHTIGAYLGGLAEEAARRGYSFNRSLIRSPADGPLRPLLTVTEGQLDYEMTHLRQKSRTRSPEWYLEHLAAGTPYPHPIFTAVSGDVEAFEKR